MPLTAQQSRDFKLSALIVFKTCLEYGIGLKELNEHTRREPVATARGVAMYLMLKHTLMTGKRIGFILGCATCNVFKRNQAIRKRLQADDRFRARVIKIWDSVVKETN